MAKEVKVGIYARVSTQRKGQNPETQLLELRKYCRDRHWAYTEYIDTGASGSTMERPALKRLQKDIHYHRINTVIIWKFDRLARNTRELLNLADDWGKRGVDLISTTQNIDTTTPGGYMFFIALAMVAEFERATLIERINAGLARARHEGKRLGRRKDKVRIPAEIAEAVGKGQMSLYRASQVTGVPRSTLKRRLIARGTFSEPRDYDQKGIGSRQGRQK